MMLTTLAALTAAMLTAQVDTTVTVPAGSRLDVHAMSGDVRVRTWSRNEVRIEADQTSEQRLEVEREGSVIRVRTVGRRGRPQAVDYRITVPAAMDLSIGGVNMDIDVEGTSGQVEISTVNGDVRLIGGGGVVELSAVNGDIHVEATRGNLEVVSVSGEVTLRNIQGRIDAETVSGRLIMDQVSSSDVAAETVSGRIYFDGPIASGGRYSFESHSGSITLGIPRNPNATIAIARVTGNVTAQLPGLRNIDFERGERRVTLGSGDAMIEAETFSGRIRIGERGSWDP